MTGFSAVALPALSSLRSLCACAFIQELHSYTPGWRGGGRGNEKICIPFSHIFSFFSFQPDNPLNSFTFLILFFSYSKRKASKTHQVHLCDFTVMALEHLGQFFHIWNRKTGHDQIRVNIPWFYKESTFCISS